MRGYIGIILVTMLMLRPGDCGNCGTLSFDKASYNVGGCASLTYKPRNHDAFRQWFQDHPILHALNLTSSSKYHESSQRDQFTLTIRNINSADRGWYTVKCTGGYTNYSLLKVNESSDGLNCGRLNFEKSRVYRGGSASLIYKPCDAKVSFAWYKDTPGGRVLLNPKETSSNSMRYTESEKDEWFILRISETRLDDAGNYFVDCGNSMSPSASLQVVEPIPPSNPEFQGVEDIYNCSKCLPGRLKVNITVKCLATGGSDPVELTLLESEKLQSSAYQKKYINNETHIITYSFIPTSDNFDTVFKCSVKNPALQVEKFVTTELYIKVDPESVDIKTQPTKENKTSNVQCTTINGRPPFKPLFYLEDILQNSVSIPKMNQSGYTYNVTATLLRNFTRQDNQASVRCCSDSSPRVCSATEYLNVTFSPQSVVLKEISKVNKENGDTVLVLKCDVDESNPKSFIEWKGVKNLPRQLLEEQYINHTATHGWTYTTNWMFNLTKEDRRRKIKCQVKNSEFPDLRLHDSYMPHITYSPVINTSAHGSEIVFIGDDVMLSCYVDSNPLSVVTWYNKTNKMEESNGTTTLDLHLVNVTIEHSQTYTCTARNGIGGEATKDITLSVKVPSKKTPSQPSSETRIVSLLVPATGGAGVIIIAIVTVVVFLTLRKKKNDAAPKRKGMHQINDERRHESVHPARNEPLENDIPASNEKEMENAPEYACVIPKANRKHEKDQLKSEDALEYAGDIPKANRKLEKDQLKSEDASEYAGIIPKAKRKSETDHLKSEDAPEYAGVIPKAKRKQGTDKQKSGDTSPKSQGDTLMYAELDLNFDSEKAARRPLTKQYEPTEYVNIDFSKTGTVKIDTGEIETGTVKIEHDEMATQSVKREDKDV